MSLPARQVAAAAFAYLVAITSATPFDAISAEQKSYWALERPKQTVEWKVVSFKDEYWPYAEFAGEAQVHGAITAEWVQPEPGAEDPESIHVLIHIPYDAKTAMPTFRWRGGSGPGWNSDPLLVRNAEAAIALSFDRKTAADFLSKRLNSIKAEGEFTIGSYVLTTGCSGWVHSSVVLVRAKIDKPLSSEPQEDGGC
jgi:hypothetical protein